MEDVFRKKLKEILTDTPGGTASLQKKTIELKKPNGYSMRYINFVLNGDRNNSQILDLAIDLVEDIIKENERREKLKKKKQKRLMARINSINNKPKEASQNV